MTDAEAAAATKAELATAEEEDRVDDSKLKLPGVELAEQDVKTMEEEEEIEFKAYVRSCRRHRRATPPRRARTAGRVPARSRDGAARRWSSPWCGGLWLASAHGRAVGRRRAKLFIFVAEEVYGDETRHNFWKERGLGTVKILRHKESGKNRCLMRQEKTLKICLNHIILPQSQIVRGAGTCVRAREAR